ncbi:hypothetical protein HHK36_024822 [Tetracentron sinense]|uniref:Uncharacterized protein n=1 Tax=Tetracentron sinense TaxID=13715 RepID=A0A834YKY4_TETSI|nr:hypothetical protein HHK36_024822 [Tetracentron sinense]
MGTGESPKCPSPPPATATAAGSFSGVRLVDAPILLLVSFHKALRADLTELHRLTLSSSEIGPPGRDLILELHRRYEFFRLVYKYHCTFEDEVIFQALDLRVRNVVSTYSLEHRSMDDLLDSVFDCLNVLLEDGGNLSKPFQELVLRTGTIQKSICQHMLKEEEQVFPLLMQHFSFKEQASLVWQFMCSVPIMLLEDFLPWMTSYLSPDEQDDVLHCIEEVVPKEKLLQEVVISWLANKLRPAFGAYSAGKNEKEASCTDELLKLKDLPKIYSSKKSLSGENWRWREADCLHSNVRHHPVDGLLRWHGAIRKDLEEILQELYEIRNSKSFSNLASVSGQLKFLADVLIFYSDALEKVFFPVLSELSNGFLSPSCQRFLDESQIECLLQLLQNCNAQSGMSLCNLVEKLCWQLKSFMTGIGKHLNFQEIEVFPLIRKNCNHEMQQWLLYTSLHMMPLGLLKCVITWLSAHLSEDESKAILHSIKLAGPLVDKSFASLLDSWVRIGYSGKTSVDKFRKELQEMCKSRISFLSEQIKEDTGFPSLNLDVHPYKKSHPGQMEPTSADKAKNCVSNSSFSSLCAEEKYNTAYSSGINLQMYFHGAVKSLSLFSKFPAEKSGAGSSLNPEPRPIDHIFFFHKALNNDLEYLVDRSATMAENVGFLMEFRRRFHLVQFLYQIHSDTEDEIAFPALEAKGKLQNISHSYTIDHKLEVEQFNNISNILDEMSELHVSLPSGFSGVDVATAATHDQRMMKYRHLCMKLHRMCKSMHKILGDHVQREEIELWPLFRECFSNEEQEKIIGCILGRTRAEILQEMIPWLMASLTPGEQHSIMSLWRKATKNTMFDEWLGEWWEGMNSYDIAKVIKESNIPPSQTEDPLEIVASYLSEEGFGDPRGNLQDKGLRFSQNGSAGPNFEPSGNGNINDKAEILNADQDNYQHSECIKLYGEVDKQGCNKIVNVTDRVEKPGQLLQVRQKFRHHEEHLLTMSQEDLEVAIRRVSRDTTLDPQKKSYIIQNLLMSRWIVTQKKSHPEVSSNGEEIPGHCPSYRDPLKLTFGCKHYKRNCKVLAACCNQLFTCRYCHHDATDHSMDRKSTTKMMCMKCLKIQPIGPTCSSASCNGLSMARYFCRICKLFDDERLSNREIYHCPYCNLCRVGKGLGIDYFHCMNCNACMSRYLAVHICREKCFEDNCPICHEYIFTSSSPVKALACGHLMHSACFRVFGSCKLPRIGVFLLEILLTLIPFTGCSLLLGLHVYSLYLPNLQQVTGGHAVDMFTSLNGDKGVLKKMNFDIQNIPENAIMWQETGEVYFGMLDALLAEEKIPQEYSGQTQVILCNDCEKRGVAPFHWLYHKCPHCGSYNTRLL